MEREKRRKRGFFSSLFEDDPWEENPKPQEEKPADEWEETPVLPAKTEEAEPEPPARKVLIQGDSPYGEGLPGQRFVQEEKDERPERHSLFDPEAQTPIEDGKTVVLVLQTILCCILLTVALVARQGNPEGFAAFSDGLRELLEGDGRTLLDQLREGPAEEFLSHVLPEKEEVSPEPEPAPEPEIETEEPLDFDWEEAGQLLENSEEDAATVMSRTVQRLGALEMPVTGALTSPYGYRVHPITEREGFHSGVDLAAAEGAPVTAALAGKVTEIGSDETYGDYVVLSHDGISTKYAHCSEILVEEGDQVRQGETIALVGNTGLSTGPHLHFEVWVEGQAVDPVWALPELKETAVLA